jgi:hypothetical protein
MEEKLMSHAVPLQATLGVRRGPQRATAPAPTPTDLPRLGIALERCSKALRYLDVTTIRDRRALHWIRTLSAILYSDGLQPPDGAGLWTKRAESLSPAQRAEFTQALDRLSAWLRTDPRHRT